MPKKGKKLAAWESVRTGFFRRKGGPHIGKTSSRDKRDRIEAANTRLGDAQMRYDRAAAMQAKSRSKLKNKFGTIKPKTAVKREKW